jgi:hypothetical protein
MDWDCSLGGLQEREASEVSHIVVAVEVGVIL